MAIQVFKDAKFLVGSYDLSGDLNNISLNYEASLLDCTMFGNNTKINYPGLLNIGFSEAGVTQTGNNLADEAMFNQIGNTTPVPITIIPSNATPADICYFFRGHHQSFDPGGTIGELYKFTAAGGGNDVYGLVRGQVLEGAVTARNATGNGTVVQAGNVSAAQFAYAVLHVVNFTGTSIVVTIKSAAAANMASNTTRFTFTTASGKTSEYLARLAGAITDNYWRADWTVTSANATIAVLLGIR